MIFIAASTDDDSMHEMLGESLPIEVEPSDVTVVQLSRSTGASAPRSKVLTAKITDSTGQTQQVRP